MIFGSGLLYSHIEAKLGFSGLHQFYTYIDGCLGDCIHEQISCTFIKYVCSSSLVSVRSLFLSMTFARFFFLIYMCIFFLTFFLFRVSVLSKNLWNFCSILIGKKTTPNNRLSYLKKPHITNKQKCAIDC